MLISSRFPDVRQYLTRHLLELLGSHLHSSLVVLVRFTHLFRKPYIAPKSIVEPNQDSFVNFLSNKLA